MSNFSISTLNLESKQGSAIRENFLLKKLLLNNRWLASVNHKDIGSLYMLTGILFGIVGSSLSGLLRMELTTIGSSSMDGHTYNVIVTGHGIVMIFFLLCQC